MITALVTAAVTAILALFGRTPSAGLVVGIAIVVKLSIVGLVLLFGAKSLLRKKAPEKAAPVPAEGAPADKPGAAS